MSDELYRTFSQLLSWCQHKNRCLTTKSGSGFPIAAKILLYSFLNHGAQWDMLRLGQRATVFVFGCIVGNRAVHVGDLDAHRTPGRSDGLPAARQYLAVFFARADAQGCGFGKDEF